MEECGWKDLEAVAGTRSKEQDDLTSMAKIENHKYTLVEAFGSRMFGGLKTFDTSA
jgi:hypothetical protein